jgi:BMFP domain-containing protein YqiC
MSSLEENAMFPSNISISDKCHWQRLSSQAFKSICADVIFEFERRMKDIAIENGKVKSPDNNETTPKLDVLQYYNTDANSKVLAALKDEIKKLEARIIEMEKHGGKSSSPATQEPKSEQAAQNPKSVSVEAAPEGIEPELAERMPDEVKKALEKVDLLFNFLITGTK